MNVTTIVLIPGLWMTALCWEHWVKHYSDKGYCVVARSWPSMEGDIEQLRRDPGSFASLGLEDVVNYYEQIIRELETPPIIIGHGFGGLVTQILLDRGWGAAGVAIASAPVKGIARLPLSMLKLAFSALGNSFRNKTASLTREQFHRAFANRIARRFQTLHRAGSQSGSVANSVRKFHSAHCKHSQFSERHARATAPGCRRQRSRGADLSRQSEFRQLSRIESRNRLQRIPRPGKFHVPSANKDRGLRARLGVLPLQWIEANRSSQSGRQLVGSTLNLTKRRPAYAR